MATRIGKNILIGCTGSVATTKLDLLIGELQAAIEGVNLRVVLTESARHFTVMRDATETLKYYTDQDEWEGWTKLGDEVLHIELGKWADLMVIAPLDANSLGKIANGLCDNLLTCTLRAWDMTKPVLFAPAMNTRMLDHPITRPQIGILIGWGYIEIPSVVKLLACGDKGDGAMAAVTTIVSKIQEQLLR